MDNESVIELSSLVSGKATLSQTGLQIDESVTFLEWEQIGTVLFALEKTIHFAIGDWINFGEHRYGEMYAQALEIATYSYETLRIDTYVANRVKLLRRRNNLSWSHHREVASLEQDKQDYYLDLAERNGLDRNELRGQIKQDRNRELLLKPGGGIVNDPMIHYGRAEAMIMIGDETVDLIITSPPYNLGGESWPMGGDGRAPRESGIGYSDDHEEIDYQQWQVNCLNECYRVAKPGASMFYNHKVRVKGGRAIHPMDWLRRSDWIIRQEIVWDRKSTHNHSPTLFWPEDERIYWLTKGAPVLSEHPIGKSTVWRCFGPIPEQSWHPAPFTSELPIMILEAVGRTEMVVLDPFMGSGTTIKVALQYGCQAIGVDNNLEYINRACQENGWKLTNEI